MLQLILGRAGTGKTEYVFSNIKKRVLDGADNVILITPEQFSFSAEKRLLSMLGESRVNSVRSLSFSRLSNEVKKICGDDDLPVLSGGAKAVLMKKAIDELSGSLSVFDGAGDDISFVSSFVSIYDELCSCRVTCDDVLAAAGNTQKTVLSQKLRDIASVISLYDAMIKDKYYDPAHELTRLYKKLLSINYFENATVFIDGFSGFVAQEYKIIEVILRQANEVFVTFCSDSNANPDRYDLFSYVNSNISILTEVAKKSAVAVLKPVILTENRRFKNQLISEIEKYAFDNMPKCSDCGCNGVEIYSAHSVDDECDFVSSKISSLLRKGIRAEKIAVVFRDTEKYKNKLGFSFKKYNIPYFDDERQNIANEPLVMFICFLLRSILLSFRSEDILSMLKTGLTDIPDKDITDLENYVYVWNINGSEWKDEFTRSPRGFVEKMTEGDLKQLKTLNKTRQTVISRLVKFSKRCKDATTLQISKAVYYALIDFATDKGLKELAMSLDNMGKSAIAAQQQRIWDLVIDILDMLCTIAAQQPVSLSEYSKMMSLMLTYEDLGVLPTGLDNVQVGSADRMRYDNPQYVFVMGANEGEFPKTVESAGLLSESDRVELIKNDFKLYSYGEKLSAQELYFAYMAVCAPSDGLFVSFCASGDNASPSTIVTGIQSVFGDICIESRKLSFCAEDLFSDENAFEIMAANFDSDSVFISSLRQYFASKPEYNNRLEAVSRLTKNEKIAISNTDIAQKLFKKDMYLSASRIEDFYNCPFQYFCKYAIKARPRRRAQLDPMQTGIVIHYILEQILSENEGKKFASLTDSEIKIKVVALLEDYLNTKLGDAQKLTASFKYRFMRLSKILVDVVIRLRDEFSHSDFEPRAFELKIGDGSKNEPIVSQKIMLPDGGSIRIKGSVDRIDTYTENGRQYVRVVDYKSGVKNFLLSDIIYGLNLQMFVYLFSVCSGNSEYLGVTGGVLYMHSSRKVCNTDRFPKSESLKRAIDENYRMQGIILNDDSNELARHMEHELDGIYIPANEDKNGDVVGSVAELSDFGAIARLTDKIITDMGCALHSGRIDQYPVNGKNHNNTCERCDYQSVCANRTEITSREIESMSDSEAMEKIRRGDSDEENVD